MGVLNSEALKGYEKKILQQKDKNNGKGALMKKFFHEHWLQVYMHSFRYVDPEIML